MPEVNLEGYEKFLSEKPKDEALKNLNALMREQFDAEIEVLRKEADLKKAKEKLKDIKERVIPTYMREELGCTEYKGLGKDGKEHGIKLKDHLSVKPPKDNRPHVYDWLIARKKGGIIKKKVSVQFGTKQEEQAAKLIEMLEKKLGFEVDVEKKVESSTLKAYVKTLLEKGDHVPKKMLGVHQFEEAVFTEGKPEDVFEGESESL